MHNGDDLKRGLLKPVDEGVVGDTGSVSRNEGTELLGQGGNDRAWEHRRLAFLIRPAFFGVLSFKGATKHIFGVRIPSTGKALFDKRFKVGGNV
jgi:hypothetical protein